MKKRESFLNSLKSAFVWKSLEKSAALIKHIVIASVVGLSVQLDVFYMAIGLIGVLVFSWALLIDVMAVPKLVQYHQDQNRDAFKSLAGSLFNFCLIFSLLLAVLIMVFSDHIAMLAYGFEPERKKLLSEAFFWLAPAMIFYIPLYQLGTAYRSVRRFSVFYRAEFLVGALTLIFIIVYPKHPRILLWSYSAGVFGSFCFLSLYARKFIHFGSRPFSKDVRSILRSAPGLMSLQISHYLFILTDRWFVSFLPKGNVGALAYARMLSWLIVGMTNMRGSFLTIFSELGSALDKKNKVYNDLFSLSILVSIPTSVFLIMFGKDLISLLLERGAFSNDDTLLVYRALIGFSWSIFPIVILGPMEQIFQAQGKIRMMVWRKGLGMLANVFFNYLSLFVFDLGIFGVAMASSIGYWIIMLCGIWAARKLGLSLFGKRMIAWSLWVLGGSLVAGILILLIDAHIAWPYFMIAKPFIFAVVFFTVVFFYRGTEGVLVKETLGRLKPGK